MRAFQKTLGILAVLTLSATQGTSQTQSDLAGAWNAKTTILLVVDGEPLEAEREFSFVIENVNGSLVRGHRAWTATTPPDQIGYVGENAVTEAREPFIGVISADGRTIHMVETQDRGSIITNILGPDQIEVTYMENAPHAVVHTAIYKRVE